jgi:hypothetical protein
MQRSAVPIFWQGLLSYRVRYESPGGVMTDVYYEIDNTWKNSARLGVRGFSQFRGGKVIRFAEYSGTRSPNPLDAKYFTDPFPR